MHSKRSLTKINHAYQHHRNASIFLSYPMESEFRAHQIKQCLESNSHSVMRDSQKLSEANIFMPILTDPYNQCMKCIQDMSMAFDLNIPFIVLHDAPKWRQSPIIEDVIDAKDAYSQISMKIYDKDITEFAETLLKQVDSIATGQVYPKNEMETGQLDLELLELMKSQYMDQKEDIEMKMEEMKQRVDVETMSKTESDYIQLVYDIFKLQMKKHQQFMVIEEQLMAKEELISKLSKQKYHDYHLFFTQFLMYNNNTNQQLQMLRYQTQEMKDTIDNSEEKLEFIGARVKQIEESDNKWSDKLRKISENIGVSLMSDGAKELISETFQYLTKL